MASAPRSSSLLFNLTENWLLIATTTLICAFAGYVVYDAVMATVSELLQRLLVISPLLLVIAVHWLSTGSQVTIGIPGSEPGAIHRAGGSPWGVAFVLVNGIDNNVLLDTVNIMGCGREDLIQSLIEGAHTEETVTYKLLKRKMRDVED